MFLLTQSQGALTSLTGDEQAFTILVLIALPIGLDKEKF